MADPFVLTLFPPGSLANSVSTTVWVGVCVTCFFNLRLGWVLSGLVVPGYLVPLFMIKPLSASVVVLEAFVTYFLVWFYSEFLSRSGAWSSFFGRDRFFALLVVSVLVRLIFDMVLLPFLGEYVTRTLEISFDYRNNLHSFGLIVVALLANQLWKPGFRRGILPAGITLCVTWFIVRHVLIPHTNFNMGNIVYMYEDMAASMLSSPKAYIILLTTAVVASRMNLRYGWDYSGILIPSLLALQWYQPEKLFFTFFETFLILAVASMVLRLSVFKDANMEGARKTLLFFNIGFVYKLLLGWMIIWWFPRYKVTDFFGFGYLLTTLLAVKMHDKGIAVRVTRAALQTSLAAVVMAGVIGFGMTFIPNVVSLKARSTARVPVMKKTLKDQRLVDILKSDRVRLFSTMEKNTYISPLPRDMEIFSEAIKAVEQYIKTRSPASLDTVNKLLALINYSLVTVEDRYLYLHEQEPRRGWGSYVFHTAPENSLMLQVPAPLEEWGALEAGTWLFTTFKSRALAMGGSRLTTNADGNADILRTRTSFFAMFQRLMHNTDILQVRGHTRKSIRVLTGRRTETVFGKPPVVDTMLWVKSSLPPGLALPALKGMIGGFNIVWGRSPFTNVLRDNARSGFAELMINRHHARDLMFKSPFADVALPATIREQSITGYLQELLLQEKENIAPKGSDRYVAPRFEELLFFDHEVLTPLIQISRQLYRDGGWLPEAENELKALNASAAVMGYEIIRCHHRKSGRDYLILAERGHTAQKRYRGIYIFRLGKAAPYVIQTPRPLSEINVFEYSISLFERIGAQCLMISTAHPLANRDGSSDIIRMDNKQSFYSLVSQVVIRESDDAPLMIVQCRAMGTRPDAPLTGTDALLALRSGVQLFDAPPPLAASLLQTLEKDRLTVRLVDGSRETAGYEVGQSPQARYLDHAVSKRFGTLWLSRNLRNRYRPQAENQLHENQFGALDIETVSADLFSVIKASAPERTALPAGYREEMTAYLQSRDIVIFYHLMHQWPGIRYKRVMDLASGQSFLLLFQEPDALAAVINLFPGTVDSRMAADAARITPQLISEYVNGRISWLEWQTK